MPKLRNDTGLRYGEGSIRQRGERFEARWLELQPDGRVTRRGRTFPTLDAAEDALRQRFRDRRDGRYVPPEERTVAMLVTEWIDRGVTRWRAWTVATYRQRYARHIEGQLGDVLAPSLTRARVQHWIDGLVRAGLEPATIDAAVRVLAAAMNEAVALDVLPSNPVHGTRRPPVAVKDVATWTEDQVRAVIAQLAGEPMWRALYRLAVTSGMRPGELRGLQWADVDLDAGVLTVRRTMTRDRDGHQQLGATTKTGRVRVIALSPSAADDLRAWQTEQKRRRMLAEVWHATGIVFDRGDGTWLAASTWQRAHERFCAAAGVPRITFHALRHTTATLELAAGTNPKIVSDRLGHTTIRTTLDRYSHVRLDVQRSAANALDDRLFGPHVVASEPKTDHLEAG